jgi:hypothetical protein
MEQSLSREANGRTADQEIPPYCVELDGSLPCLRVPHWALS